jgi:nicotinamide mononucleotide transporter
MPLISLQSFYQQFIADLKNASLLEFVAVFFGMISVWFSKKEKIWVFPTGIINTGLFTYIYCIKSGLYADGLVNIYYTIMSILGWYMWTKKTSGNVLQISQASTKDWLQSLAVTLFWFACLCLLLVFIMPKFLSNYFTPSDVPYIDSLNAALAFTAMWLMNKKKINHWWFWIVVNLISIPLNAYKNLAWASIQYVVFLIIAILGLIEWKQKINEK